MIAAVAVMSEIAFRTENPSGLPRLPDPGLGRAALRTPRRDAGDRRRGRLRGLEHHALPRAVRRRLGHAQRPHHPALHRRRGTVDAGPRRPRLRAQPLRRGARRVAGTARRGLRRRAPAARAQPPRRRPAAPERARRAAGDGGRARARGRTTRRRRCSRTPRPRWSSPSTSCASCRTASSRRSCPTWASRGAQGDRPPLVRAGHLRREAADRALRRHRRGDGVLRVRRGAHQRAEARARLLGAGPADRDERRRPARDRRRRHRRCDRGRRRWPRRTARPCRGARRNLRRRQPRRARNPRLRDAAAAPARRRAAALS